MVVIGIEIKILLLILQKFHLKSYRTVPFPLMLLQWICRRIINSPVANQTYHHIDTFDTLIFTWLTIIFNSQVKNNLLQMSLYNHDNNERNVELYLILDQYNYDYVTVFNDVWCGIINLIAAMHMI